MHDIKVMMTTVDTVPAIAGSSVELEVDDEPVIGGDGITVRNIHICMHFPLYPSNEIIMITNCGGSKLRGP